MSMYRVAHTTKINSVDVPYYKCLRGSNSLEGFHKLLPNMIPGPDCEPVEVNFRGPADLTSNELLRLEYLSSQSTGESGTFSLEGIVSDGPGPEEEVVQPGQPEPDHRDEAYQSDKEARDTVLDTVLPDITLTNDETSIVHPPAFEDACSSNPLPGFEKLEVFCCACGD